jgi:hypothetical protein
MSPPPDPPLKRSLLVPQFSLGTLMWLMVVTGMALVWWKDRSSLDQRIQKLEQMYSPQRQVLWSAADILGAPDDPTGGSGKSWCPLNARAVDWVEVGFDRPVAAATIDLYETYSVGCVTEVIVIDKSGVETSIWKGTDPTTPVARAGLFRVPVPASTKSVQRVKIRVDSTGNGSWACMDAVGLTTSGGKTTWATSSDSSSIYGGSSLSAESKKEPWFTLW